MDELIPRDLCDNDLYAFTQTQLAWRQFPAAIAKFKYINRAEDKSYPKGFASRLMEQVKGMTDLRFTDKMYAFLKQKPWLKETFLQWLRQYRFNPEQVKASQNEAGELSIEITGPWFETILWEVPLLYIATQLSRTDSTGHLMTMSSYWLDLIQEKGERLYQAGVNWIDFGTRRRAAYVVQDAVCQSHSNYFSSDPNKSGFRGTSNPYLAMKYGISSHGTFSHMLVQAMQARYGITMCNERAMHHWVEEYRGELGIALTDTLTTPIFLRDFDKYYAQLFQGVRQDSGNCKEIAEMIIAHYEKLGIDPKDKIIVFSDSLNVDKAIDLHKTFKGRIKTTMGIGTSIVNDVGWLPSNHVIKLTEMDFGHGFIPVLKISDDKGKITGSKQLYEDACRTLGIEHAEKIP